MELKYKKASIGDIELIYHQAKQLIECYEKSETLDLSKILSWVKNKIKTNIDDYTIIYYDNKIIGCYRMIENNRLVELDDFYLLESYQSQGIGSEVLRRICTTIKKPIYLYVFNENKVAIHLYQKFGFVFKEDLRNGRSIMVRK